MNPATRTATPALKEHLFTPGPTNTPLRLLQAMAVPMLHHRTDVFKAILREAVTGLQELLHSETAPLLLTASGTGAMEAAVLGICQPGDSVVVLHAGSFGKRWVEICQTHGIAITEVTAEWGSTFKMEDVETALRKSPAPRAVLVQYSETSTGVLHPVPEIIRLVKKLSPDTLTVVDAISAIATLDINLSELPIDILVAAAHKGLMLPPGLAILALSSAAWKVVNASKPRSHYFDLPAEKDWQDKGTTTWTPATTLIAGLVESLRMLREQGHQAVYRRHRVMADATRAALKALGLQLLAEGCHATGVTAAYPPADVDSENLRSYCLSTFGVRLAGGQGKLKGKIFRIGHMGYADRFDVLTAVNSVEMGLHALGAKGPLGRAAKAALEVFVAADAEARENP